MKIIDNKFFIFDGQSGLIKTLADEVLNLADKAIFENDRFDIVLTGGKSILGFYKTLSLSDSNWKKWHIYISDERYLPNNHKDRNDRVINDLWLNNEKIPRKNIHFFDFKSGVVHSIKTYEHHLKKINKFSLVLLSVGDDGHVASLFPGHSHRKGVEIIVEKNSPKYPKKRVSMSYDLMNKSSFVFKIIIGSEKKVVSNMLTRGFDLPASKVNGDSDKVFICVQ
jgi:6-phosphogluconolactonase